MSSFHVVFFDCDSTLTKVEGIDELGHRKGVGDKLAALTNQAMNGEIPLEQVYGQRLELVRPSRDDLRWLGERYVEQTVEGARELIDALHALGKRVVVVSGGLQDAVVHLARVLEVPDTDVHAVPVLFDDQGQYSGFVEAHPLARNGGKPIVCRNVLAALSARQLDDPPGTRSEAMIQRPRSAFVGDGNTDLEARSVCDAFVGFGGVVAREKVRAKADHFIDAPGLHALIDVLLSEDERKKINAG